MNLFSLKKGDQAKLRNGKIVEFVNSELGKSQFPHMFRLEHGGSFVVDNAGRFAVNKKSCAYDIVEIFPSNPDKETVNLSELFLVQFTSKNNPVTHKSVHCAMLNKLEIAQKYQNTDQKILSIHRLGEEMEISVDIQLSVKKN